jgi:hypothetical protein
MTISSGHISKFQNDDSLSTNELIQLLGVSLGKKILNIPSPLGVYLRLGDYAFTLNFERLQEVTGEPMVVNENCQRY